MSEKLQKVLARAGHGSRRKIESIINAGRIKVNDNTAKLGDRIDIVPRLKIYIDGHLVSIKNLKDQFCRVLGYHKQAGELCSYKYSKKCKTVFDRLPKLRGKRWVSVGRLDLNSSGLLLFTTDGELANRLMHPNYKIEREYAVRIFGKGYENKLCNLLKNVQLKDGPASFKTIKFNGGKGMNRWYRVTITEGRNREVRRIFETIGVQVNRLIRIRYGNILLPRWLPCGSYRELNFSQIKKLRMLTD